MLHPLNTSMARAQLQTILVLILIAALFVGCGRPSASTVVGDVALFDGELYVLINHVESVNHASPLSHSVALEQTRQVLGIAKASIVNRQGESLSKLEILATCVLNKPPFYDFGGVQLCATNRCVASGVLGSAPEATMFTDGLTFGAETSLKQSIQPLRRNVRFTGSRKLFFGCSSNLLIVDSRTFQVVSNAILYRMGAILCDDWLERAHWNDLAVSDDLHTLVLKHHSWDPPQLQILRLADSIQTNRLDLPNRTYDLVGFFETKQGSRLLFTCRTGEAVNQAVIFDGNGKEVGRCQLDGAPAANADCTTIVALDPKQRMALDNGKRLPLKVWLPDSQQEYTLSLDTSSVLKAMKRKWF
ncbi:MAG: hypothetical protein HY299_15475 [Verrucomicrobia bacterium]|nr:hypothetical protein [Verrucomicrobiota bacterium]